MVTGTAARKRRRHSVKFTSDDRLDVLDGERRRRLRYVFARPRCCRVRKSSDIMGNASTFGGLKALALFDDGIDGVAVFADEQVEGIICDAL